MKEKLLIVEDDEAIANIIEETKKIAENLVFTN